MDTQSLILSTHAMLAAPFVAILAAWFMMAAAAIIYVAATTRD